MMLETRAVQPEPGAARIGLLDAHVEPEEPQLVDDVGAGAGVGGRADRAAADRAGEHADVGAGVLFGEEARRPRTAGARRRSDERSSRLSLTVLGRIWPTGYSISARLSRGARRQAHPAGVERHADDGIHADRIEALHLLHRRDAAGGGQPPRRGVAHGFDRAHVGALHQPFAIDVGVEELAGVRARARGPPRSASSSSIVRQPSTTTWPPRLSTAAMNGRRVTASATRLANSTSTAPFLKSDDARMTPVAPSATSACARSGVRMPPPTRQGSRAQIVAIERLVRARVLRRVEVDELHLRIAREALDPAVDVARLDGQPLALHELHDPAALEIDRRYQHQSRVGTPRACRNCFEIRDRVLGVVEDRRRQRRVGLAGGEDVEEVVERAGAARGDDRESTPRSRPRR